MTDMREKVARAMLDAVMFDGDRLSDWLDLTCEHDDLAAAIAPAAQAAITALWPLFVERAEKAVEHCERPRLDMCCASELRSAAAAIRNMEPPQ